MPEPSPSDGITIWGGVGPTTADLGELRAAAIALRHAADRLDDATTLVAAADRIVRLGAQDSPATALAARHALAPLRHGPASVAVGADRLHDLARALRAAAQLYGDAEDRAGAVVRTLLATAGGVLGGQPVAAAFAAFAAARAALSAGGFALGAALVLGKPIPSPRKIAVALPAEDLMTFLGGFVRGLALGRERLDPTPVPDAAEMMVVATALSSVVVPVLRRRPMRVTPLLGATAGPAPADAAEVLRDVGALYPGAGGTAGTVGIERLDRPDGSRAWVVAIPGTQDAGLGWGPNPMDMATNLRLMAGAADDGTALVTRALDQAGVAAGEPVLLAGHSQGGLVAMVLAGDEAFTSRYDVAAVLTAGSPVGALAVPVAIPVLHLENRQDLVWAADGLRSPAQPNRTTATRDLRASGDPADRIAARDPVAAHGVDSYVRTARAASASGAPSVLAWEKAAGQVLGGPGTSAVRMEFTATRLRSAAGSPP